MGQADSQFKAFIRFILDDMEEIRGEKDEKKKAGKVDKVIQNLKRHYGRLTQIT